MIHLPIELAEANAFVAKHHRHHKPVIGHRFSLGALKEGKLVGIAIVGRPVARGYDIKTTVEVTRLCTDGTQNACSFLYAAAAKVARAMNFLYLQTYILESEAGTSLKAAGWSFEEYTAGGQWVHSTGPRRTDQPTEPKARWVLILKPDSWRDRLAREMGL